MNDVLCCVFFHAERSINCESVDFSINVEFQWPWVVWLWTFILIMPCITLKPPSRLPTKANNLRTPGYRFRYSICSSWPLNRPCKLIARWKDSEISRADFMTTNLVQETPIRNSRSANNIYICFLQPGSKMTSKPSKSIKRKSNTL